MSAAIIPTGKKRKAKGGGGSGGNTSGSTTIDAVNTAMIKTAPKLKQRPISFLLMLVFLFSPSKIMFLSAAAGYGGG
ncbi:hypothetical protein TanjilG_19220 [Lupinus angustifolius]|uniref:Uncharacterized protein n=1 Tax=Lupinus angustifolius TaxID=3871 RepID=A0A1J7HVQ5_LUPAN|nr:hypothetical protein TanjilG_19220 [Lupinus angustifolius]